MKDRAILTALSLILRGLCILVWYHVTKLNDGELKDRQREWMREAGNHADHLTIIKSNIPER